MVFSKILFYSLRKWSHGVGGWVEINRQKGRTVDRNDNGVWQRTRLLTSSIQHTLAQMDILDAHLVIQSIPPPTFLYRSIVCSHLVISLPKSLTQRWVHLLRTPIITIIRHLLQQFPLPRVLDVMQSQLATSSAVDMQGSLVCWRGFDEMRRPI